MNGYDLQVWTAGRAKLAAGLPLTDAETEVLRYFGGESALRPVAAPMERKHLTATPMPGHYRTEAEWLAAFRAIVGPRDFT